MRTDVGAAPTGPMRIMVFLYAETIMSAKQAAVTLRRHPLAYKTSCVPTPPHTFVPLERSLPH